MKSLFLLLLLFAVPVVVAQTIVEAPLIDSTPPPIPVVHDTAAWATTASEVTNNAVSDSDGHGNCDCVASHVTEIVASPCTHAVQCCCGRCCHVGDCAEGSPCTSNCEGMCCNHITFDEHGNVVHVDERSEGQIVRDGSSTPVGGSDSYSSSGTSVRGFGGGGGSGISAFSGGLGVGYSAVGGGGGGGGRRAVAFAGFGARRFRGQRSLSASD